MNARTFCERQTDRGFVLALLPDAELIPLAVEVDQRFQSIPSDQERDICHALYCLQDVYREIGRRAVISHLGNAVAAPAESEATA